MGFEVAIFLIIAAAVIVFIVVSTKTAKEKSGKAASAESSEDAPIVDEGGKVYDERTIFSKDDIKERIASEGYDTSNPEYLYISDMGVNYYVKSYYVEEMPLTLKFATSFRGLFQFRDVTSAVPTIPMDKQRAIETLKKNITKDDAEIIDAHKRINSTREEEMRDLKALHMKWLKDIQSGDGCYLESCFIFTLRASSLAKLEFQCQQFTKIAKKPGIVLCACFGWQDIAYQATAPNNTIASDKVIGTLFSRNTPIKWHVFDEKSIATMFNHTNTSFTHPRGIMAGHNLETGEIINIDPYAKSHNGYAISVVGMPGCGKSVMCKVFIARLAHFGYRFACIDTDRVKGRGEYSGVCDAVDGVNYELRTNSPNRLNLFELDEQEEFDPYMNRSHRVLRLMNKTSDIYKILLYIINYHKVAPDAATATFMERIIKTCVVSVYEERGIYDGEPDSLYVDDEGYEGGVVGAGKKRKTLPTMSDAFLWILRRKRENTNGLYNLAYQMLEDIFADLVDELYYDEDTLERVPKAEFDIREISERNIKRVKGTRGYFDGQSTIAVNRSIPFINIDISDLPEDDKALGQQVAMSFLMEHFIKKNSENLEKAQKICLIVDEAHRLFNVAESRKFLSDQIRTARKNNASMWTITQSYADFLRFDETEDIIKNAAMKFIFKQSPADRRLLEEKANLTPRTVGNILALGGDPNDLENKDHKGEVCLVDGDNVVFMKVDYLRETEAVFAESDVSILQGMAEVS